MIKNQWFAGCFVLAIASVVSMAQTIPAESGNDARIDALLHKLTLEEKMNLIRGGQENPADYQGQAGFVRGVPRLHIPSLRFSDGPPGVLTRVPSQAETATMGVAATFSTEDAEANGVLIGRDARSLGIDVVLQPFINIDRDIAFARSYNTFGEDPLLTGAIGAAEIRGIQSQDVMAQAKHFVGFDSDSFNVFMDQQTLHEVYAAPFADAVQAGVSSIMCSYNRINGPFACGNADTLKTLLKEQFGFKGFVTSDWGAVHSVSFINKGLDMEMPGPAFFATAPKKRSVPSKPKDGTQPAIIEATIPEEPLPVDDSATFPRDSDQTTMRGALKDGSVTVATITTAARRVLYEMDRFGYLDGHQKHTITPQDIEENASVILRTAEDAAVLLKNDDHALPLKATDLQSVALIGPGAGQLDAIGVFGERSGGLTERQIGPLEALRKFASDAHISYAVDDDMTGSPIEAAMLSHNGKPGLLRTNGNGATTVDAQLDHTVSNHNPLPANGKVTWKGSLTVVTPGVYWIYLQVLGARAIMRIDGKEVGQTGANPGDVHGDVQQATQDNVFPTTDGLDNVRRAVELTAGPHEIKVEASGDTSGNPEQVRLNWITPERRLHDHHEAIELAKRVHTPIVFLWTRGEPTFGLPGEQDKLVEEIAAVNPNTIVVLSVSQPIAMPWLSKVKAVVQMWWPGDEGGWATADILLGKANPAGRLPFTWAHKLEDYPATDPAYPERSAKGIDGKTTFSEGVDVGYRWFDKQKIEPLFAFGYGLSYSHFRYSGLKVVNAADGGLEVSVWIKNEGPLAGDEVPQVYLDAPLHRPSGVQFAPKTLAAFERVTLGAGETKQVRLHVAPRSLEYWSIAEDRWVRSSARRLRVGKSSRDLKLEAVAQ